MTEEIYKTILSNLINSDDFPFFCNQMTISYRQDPLEITAFGDEAKIYIPRDGTVTMDFSISIPQSLLNDLMDKMKEQRKDDPVIVNEIEKLKRSIEF